MAKKNQPKKAVAVVSSSGPSRRKTSSPGQYFNWAVPPKMKAGKDSLQMRLDIYSQAITLTMFDGDIAATKMVSAMDVAHALATELRFSTGILPENTLWWINSKDGPIIAVYQLPRIWKVALQENFNQPATRFTIPLPALLFLCSPLKAPWVYAVKRRPTKLEDIIYKAPLANVFETGRTCAGSQKYAVDPKETINLFFVSFFTKHADLENRSVKYPKDITKLWTELNGKKEYPLDDLVRHGTVQDLLKMEMDL